MRPGKGNWGPTQMLRYAIEELDLDPGRTEEGRRETIVKLMRKELQRQRLTNEDGGCVYPEAEAKRIVKHNLRDFFEEYYPRNDVAIAREAEEGRRHQLAKESAEEKFERVEVDIPTVDPKTGMSTSVKTSIRTGLYAAVHEQYIESLEAYSEGETDYLYEVSDQELLFAEMRLALRYVIEHEGASFDIDSFERDYRQLRQAKIDSSIENDEPNELAEEQVLILWDKLNDPDAYIEKNADSELHADVKKLSAQVEDLKKVISALVVRLIESKQK